MRFLVFGAGALGSLVGARLADAHEVVLVTRSDHARAIRERGLRVEGATVCLQTALAAVTGVDEVGPPSPEVILLTVKAYDTARAARALSGFGTSSLFVSLQNGLGNEEILARHASRVLGAVINQGVTFMEPGRIYHAGEGETELGAFQGTSRQDAERVAKAFAGAGLPARVVEDVRERIWMKAVLNAAVNPLTALLKKRSGEIIGDDALEASVRLVVEESVAIARAAGYPLDPAAILDKIRSVCAATRDNKSSMLQDLERERRTEIDAINGALVERARALGIPCRTNELLTHMVHAAERHAASRAP